MVFGWRICSFIVILVVVGLVVRTPPKTIVLLDFA
jgi:hypothetical protein